MSRQDATYFGDSPRAIQMLQEASSKQIALIKTLAKQRGYNIDHGRPILSKFAAGISINAMRSRKEIPEWVKRMAVQKNKPLDIGVRVCNNVRYGRCSSLPEKHGR